MCLAIPAKIVELFPEEQNRALIEVAGVYAATSTPACWLTIRRKPGIGF